MSNLRPCRLPSAVVGPALLLTAMAAPAQATGIEMRGTVPTICEATLGRVPVPSSPTRLDLGPLSWRCNNGEGYRMVLHTPPGISRGMVVLGGRPVQLSPNGITVIIDSNEPAWTSDRAFIDFAFPIAPETIPVRVEIVPKGVVFHGR